MTIRTGSTGICCLAISIAIQTSVYFPGTSNYTASLGSYFSLQETAVQPLCIVAPKTTQDVSTAIRILTTTNDSTPTGCQFSIRSGGHASFAGAANIAGGVTLDLSGLHGISLAAAEDNSVSPPTVSVGVGSTWGSVYNFLDPFQLSVSGARAASVGVGGLLLGGGISYFGTQTGWACDSVINFEVVLANGDVVNANATHNAELLWALRGGTKNFGVVTRIDLRTFRQGNLWGGQVDRLYSTADSEITALADFSNSDTTDFQASLITTFAYSGAENVSVVVNNMEYTQPVANPPVFDSFTSLPSLYSTQRITNMSDLARETAANDPNGQRQATATVTIHPTVDAINATVRAWESSLPVIRDQSGIVWAIGFDPLPTSLYARHAEGNAMGLDSRQGTNLLVVQLTMTWNDAGDDEIIEKAARGLISKIQDDVGALGALDAFIYINYAAAWQDPFTGYGRVSLERLRAVQRKYDPRRVFTHLVPGGFKIPAH